MTKYWYKSKGWKFGWGWGCYYFIAWWRILGGRNISFI